MNAEELLSIAANLNEDLREIDLLNRLNNLRDALQGLINQPAQPQLQEQLSAERTALAAALAESRTNEYPPVWRSRLEELGFSDVLGASLAAQLDEVFSRNEITLQAALDQLEPIRERVEEIVEALRETQAGLTGLGFETDVLEPGECELSVLIPATGENREADRLATELAFVDGAVKLFSELAGLGRPATQVRALASSDFLVYVYVAVEVAKDFGAVIDYVTQLHTKLRRLKEIVGEFIELSGPEAVGDGMQAQVTAELETGIDEITETIVQSAKLDDSGRVTELRTEISRTVRGVAARVDNGFRYELRAELPEGNSESNEGEEQSAHLDVQQLASRIEYSPPVLHPILELPPVGRFVTEPESGEADPGAHVD